ncbi:hypothetical protein CY34DRAFT_99526 [Suillus luteus UH-Slu-Lm8-n1]|uniref:Unplaced genomic scaffold CY34scaffold_803, whole genome shotgun sequence n=1 Tax=Suillus luteus UH-Slu-Lm8-n1 TaxID=930992 RepID=A0A0C9Z7I4_9AGAM|nr:hypothetical protein CY34DRAFT_99526 [Suillus luteus UH-Slu-Lm8-n1]
MSSVPALNEPPPSSRVTVRWDSDCTDALVQFLDTHPADCRVLFNKSKKTRDMTIDEPSPSGNKTKIWAAIAQYVFENNEEYGSVYAEDKNKFAQAVSNRLNYLRGKYKKFRHQFNQTGAGINPLDANGGKNLQQQVLLTFPWFEVLDGLWKDNPVFVPNTISSAPGMNHAGGLAALTKGKRGGQ